MMDFFRAARSVALCFLLLCSFSLGSTSCARNVKTQAPSAPQTVHSESFADTDESVLSQGESSFSAVSSCSEEESEAQTSSFRESEDPTLLYPGTLFEYRRAYSEYVLPAKSGSVIGGNCVTDAADAEQPLILEVAGHSYTMHLMDVISVLNSDGIAVDQEYSYATGPRFFIGMRSSAVYGDDGALRFMRLNDFLIDGEITQENMVNSARRIAGELCDFDLENMTCVIQTSYMSENGTLTANKFIPAPDESSLSSFIYTVSYNETVGGIKSGKYIDVVFSPFDAPLRSTSIRLGYDHVDAYKDLAPFDVPLLLQRIKENVNGILQDDYTADEIDLDESTLIFTVFDGKPAVKIDSLITVDGNQYQTSLLYVFDDGAFHH